MMSESVLESIVSADGCGDFRGWTLVRGESDRYRKRFRIDLDGGCTVIASYFPTERYTRFGFEKRGFPEFRTDTNCRLYWNDGTLVLIADDVYIGIMTDGLKPSFGCCRGSRYVHMSPDCGASIAEEVERESDTISEDIMGFDMCRLVRLAYLGDFSVLDGKQKNKRFRVSDELELSVGKILRRDSVQDVMWIARYRSEPVSITMQGVLAPEEGRLSIVFGDTVMRIPVSDRLMESAKGMGDSPDPESFLSESADRFSWPGTIRPSVAARRSTHPSWDLTGRLLEGTQSRMKYWGVRSGPGSRGRCRASVEPDTTTGISRAGAATQAL